MHRIPAPRKGLEAQRIFGGTGYLLDGNMCCEVWREFLIARVGPAAFDDAMNQPITGKLDITERALEGWGMVEPDGTLAPDDLKIWTSRAVHFNRSLPSKLAPPT